MKRTQRVRLVRLGTVTAKTQAVSPPGAPEVINPVLAFPG